MWVKQCHKPLMTGNGKFIPPIKMLMTGGWFMMVHMTLFYPHCHIIIWYILVYSWYIVGKIYMIEGSLEVKHI